MQSLAAHGRSRRRRRRLTTTVVVVLLLVAAGVGTFLVLRSHSTSNSASSAAGSRGTRGAHGATGASSTTAPARTLSVVSTTPVDGASGVASDATVTVTLSDAVAPDSPMPTLDPPVAGSWTRSGRAVTFTPSAPFVPGTAETLTVPSGPLGVHTASSELLSASLTAHFTIAKGSELRLEQLLGQLGYLPVGFTQSGPQPPPAQLAMDQPGTFAWRWATFPSDLTALWIQGTPNIITKGAVMTFENQHGLAVDGDAGPQVWAALLKDAAAGKLNAAPWTYAYVNKNLPETLTIFVNGNPQYANIPVNTGVPGADTVDGTYTVFEHVQSSEMKGTNVDGSTYDDPNVPWASYFNGGDALHGYPRPSYGSPQSNGCVEMPIDTAGTLWPLTPIGTLVTVVGPAS